MIRDLDIKIDIDQCTINAACLNQNILNEIVCSTGKIIRDKLVAVANQVDMLMALADGIADFSVND